MKKILNLFCVMALSGIFCVAFVSCGEPEPQKQTQEPEEPEQPEEPEKPLETDYYYFAGSVYYLGLDTRRAYLSLREPEMPDDILRHCVGWSGKFLREYSSGLVHPVDRDDMPERYYTEIYFSEASSPYDILSDEEYMNLLSEINNEYQGIIIEPIFYEKWGGVLMESSFFVNIKKSEDRALLEQEAEKADLILVRCNGEIGQEFLLCFKENSEPNAPMVLANRFQESGMFEWACPSILFGRDFE